MTRTELAPSHQDTVPGHKRDHDRKQSSENLYVTIQEAARRCGVSDKTIQRAIRTGTLLAQHPKKNRCEIAVKDLDTFMPGHVQAATTQRRAQQASGHVQVEMQQRIVALEQRVQHLEQLVATVLNGQSVSKQQSKAKAREHTTGPLPKHCVSLQTFTRHHRIAECTVQTHMEMGLLPVKRGTWTDTDGMEVTVALDTKGRTAFYQLYHGDMTHFAPCPHCPHGYRDSVSGYE